MGKAGAVSNAKSRRRKVEKIKLNTSANTKSKYPGILSSKIMRLAKYWMRCQIIGPRQEP